MMKKPAPRDCSPFISDAMGCGAKHPQGTNIPQNTLVYGMSKLSGIATEQPMAVAQPESLVRQCVLN